jgi:hypothetical protein
MNQEDKMWCIERLILSCFKRHYGESYKLIMREILNGKIGGLPKAVLFLIFQKPLWVKSDEYDHAFKKVIEREAKPHPLDYC